MREISDRVGEEYASRSEAVRALIDKGLEHDDPLLVQFGVEALSDADAEEIQARLSELGDG